MRKLSTLLVVLVFAAGSILMVGCEKPDATKSKDGEAKSTETSSNDSETPEASNLTEVSFEVTGMK